MSLSCLFLESSNGIGTEKLEIWLGSCKNPMLSSKALTSEKKPAKMPLKHKFFSRPSLGQILSINQLSKNYATKPFLTTMHHPSPHCEFSAQISLSRLLCLNNGGYSCKKIANWPLFDSLEKFWERHVKDLHKFLPRPHKNTLARVFSVENWKSVLAVPTFQHVFWHFLDTSASYSLITNIFELLIKFYIA